MLTDAEKSSLRSFISGIATAIKAKKKNPSPISGNNFASEIMQLYQTDKLIDGSIESYESNAPIGKVREGMFKELENLESISLGAIDGEIEDKAFYGCAALETIDITSCKGVGESAFEGCTNATTLNLGVVNGPIGHNAFNAMEAVEHFSIDPSSNITELSEGCFAGLGYNRHENERFYMDLRNSTFETFYGFNQYAGSSGSGGNQSESAAAITLSVSNMEIRLPATVKYIGAKILFNDVLYKKSLSYSDSGYTIITYLEYRGMSPSEETVLTGAENVDVYIISDGITISGVNSFPQDIDSHVFVLYDFLGNYLDSVNWCGLPNLYGFAVYPNNTNLPTTTTSGHSISWYSDKACTISINKGNGNEIYCRATGTRNKVRIDSRGIEDAIITITDSNSNTYQIGDLVDVGTSLTIRATCDLPTSTDIKYFSVNGNPLTTGANGGGYLSSKTVTVGNTDNITIMCSYSTYPADYYWPRDNNTLTSVNTNYFYMERDKIAITNLRISKFTSEIPNKIITFEEVLADVNSFITYDRTQISRFWSFIWGA